MSLSSFIRKKRRAFLDYLASRRVAIKNAKGTGRGRAHDLITSPNKHAYRTRIFKNKYNLP